MANNTPYTYGTSAPKLYSAYNQSAAAPKRNYDDETRRRSSRMPETPIKVVPTRTPGSAPSTSAAPFAAPALVKVAAIVAAMFLVIGLGRITLDSATCAMAMEASDISSQIELARDGANTLEVEQSTLSNPTRIKEQAAALGMTVSETTTFIDISGDVVVTDETGRLSLSGSIDALN
jgi:cell division protein FtsL